MLLCKLQVKFNKIGISIRNAILFLINKASLLFAESTKSGVKAENTTKVERENKNS